MISTFIKDNCVTEKLEYKGCMLMSKIISLTQATHPTVCPLKFQDQLLQEMLCDSSMNSRKIYPSTMVPFLIYNSFILKPDIQEIISFLNIFVGNCSERVFYVSKHSGIL